MKHDYICHYNEWWWGKTYQIITKDGYGTVEIQFDDSYPSIAFIKGLSVYKSKRKQGIGTELINWCNNFAIEKGYPFLQLSVNKEQDWLVNWYKTLGFVTIMKDDHEYTMLKQI